MDFIVSEREEGKTTRLIELAHNRNAYIVCMNEDRARNVFKMSKHLGKNILYPITLEEYINDRRKGIHHLEFLLDDVDEMIYSFIRRYLFKYDVTAVSSCSEVIPELLNKMIMEGFRK